MNPGTGAVPTCPPANCTDIYLRFAHDGVSQTQFSAMTTNAQRALAASQVDNVVWTGEDVAAAVPFTLSFGRPQVALSGIGPTTVTTRVGPASFGPPLTAAGISQNVVVGNDGIINPAAGASVTDACEPLVNAAAVAGKIALVDRGFCAFLDKVKNAQAAGAIAVLVADNVPANPPPGLTGTDPTVMIPSARIQQATGNAIKAALASGAVFATLSLDLSRRAGTDLLDRALLYATNPVQPGSSFSHWDLIASRNQLMEPAYNPDLTHNLIAPFDLTRAHFHDIGWFTDANLDGTPDATVLVNGCDTGLAEQFTGNGSRLSDQVRAWMRACTADPKNRGQITSCMAHAMNDAVRDGVISGAQKGAIQSCPVPTPTGS
jgi:hypothetical protein